MRPQQCSCLHGRHRRCGDVVRASHFEFKHSVVKSVVNADYHRWTGIVPVPQQYVGTMASEPVVQRAPTKLSIRTAS